MKIKERIGQLSENSRIVLKNSMGALVVRGGSLVVSMLTMPAFMRFFEDQAILGVWFTLLSIINWIMNFDVGIGNGLRNKLTIAIAAGDTDGMRRYISSAYLILGLLTLALSVVGYALLSYIPWNGALGVATDAVSPEVMMLAIRNIFFGIMLQFFLRTISSILYALQQSALNNLIALLISVLQLLFVLLYPRHDIAQENLIILSYAYILLANVPFLFATVAVFATKLRGVIPTPSYVSVRHCKEVLSLGGMFFLCQVLFMLVMNTNEFLISHYTGPESVVDYQIYNRLFTLVGTMINLALTPMWSSVTKAVAEGNQAWVRRLFMQLERLVVVAAALQFLLVPPLQLVVNLWLGAQAVSVDYGYALAFAVYGSALIYTNMTATIACGTGKLMLQGVCFAVGVVGKFLVVYFVMPVYPSWIFVVLLNTAILVVYSIVQHIALRREIGRMRLAGSV